MCICLVFRSIPFFLDFFSVCFNSELPHSPRNLQASLNSNDSRSVDLSWMRPFDGNSPLLHYVVELSENSKTQKNTHTITHTVELSQYHKNQNFTFQFLKAVKESVFGSISYSRSRCNRSQCWVASKQAHGCSPSQRHTASWSQLRASLLDSGVKRHDVQKQGKPTQIDWSSRAGIGQWGMCWSGGEDYCCGL